MQNPRSNLAWHHLASRRKVFLFFFIEGSFLINPKNMQCCFKDDWESSCNPSIFLLNIFRIPFVSKFLFFSFLFSAWSPYKSIKFCAKLLWSVNSFLRHIHKYVHQDIYKLLSESTYQNSKEDEQVYLSFSMYTTFKLKLVWY